MGKWIGTLQENYRSPERKMNKNFKAKSDKNGGKYTVLDKVSDLTRL